MVIRLREIDPAVAGTLAPALVRAEQGEPPPPFARRLLDQLREFVTRDRSGGNAVLAVLGFLLLAAAALAAAPCVLLLAGGAALVDWWQRRSTEGARRRAARRRLRGTATGDQLRAALPLAQLQPLERLYGEALASLADLLPDLEKQRAREIRDQLNALLAHGRALEREFATLDALHLAQPAERLDLEAAALRDRLERAADPVARAALEQSLQLCRVRLENARALPATLERLAAQREVIYQTLGSVRSTLTRSRTAPERFESEEADQLAEMVRRINAESGALEEAVEEVLHLGRE